MNRLLGYAWEALDAIWRRRTRSALTLLGMIIGTASVIAVLGISQAASNAIAASLGTFGDPGVFAGVDPSGDDPPAAAIYYRDVATVMREDAAFVRYAEPDYSRAFRIAANGVDYVGTVTNATPPEFDRLALREGRRIDDADVAAHAHVAVLTRRLESRLFGPDGEAVGRIVRVDGVRFRIVGVYAEFAASIFSSAGVSDYIEVPYSVLHDLVPGPVDDIDFWVRPGVAPSAASGAVRATLQRLHGARAGYRIEDAFALLERFERVIAVVSYGLAAIGCVALLVAGIGIMNVMLVSVSERTREIGIRKAIGGSARDITTQFLIEALVLSLVGGTIGLFLGVASVLAVSGLITSTLGPAPLPWTLIVVVAVLFSTAIGVLFGTYPAMRAGRLDPIVALRS